MSVRNLVARLKALVAQEREVRALRLGLVQQAGEAAAQQERNRLARELHDSIKQQIFSINMSAAAVQARWDKDPEGARQALADVQRSGQEAMVEMNALLQQLSPVPLEKVGLRQALLDQCEALGYRTGAAVEAEFGELPDDDLLPPGAQKDLFRIAQEALSNVARHARARSVRLHMGLDGPKGSLILEIEDDGHGFNMDARPEGMGLPNIRERVQALGGAFSLDSRLGRGTRLCIRIPLSMPVLPEQMRPAYRLDNTLNKVILVGLGGGLALIAVLLYPLYTLYPGQFVEGWLPSSGLIAFALVLAAPPLAVATGFLAARWSNVDTRQAGALLGGLAGGVAGLLLYFGLVAPTAGVAGNAPLLAHGLVPASTSYEARRLLSEAATGLVWAVYGTCWISVMAGLGLGTIGGLLARPGGRIPNRPSLRLPFISVLPTAIATSVLCLIAALIIFPQPETAMYQAAIEAGASHSTVLPLAGVSLWPTCTAAVLYLASLAALWFLLRAEIRSGDAARLCAGRIQAVTLGLLALGIPVLMLFIAREALLTAAGLRAAVLVVAACSLVLGGLFLTIFVEAQRRRRALALPPLRLLHGMAIMGALLSLVALAWAAALPSWLSILSALLVIIADLVLIAVLLRQPSPAPPDGGAMAQAQLAMSRSINGALGSVVALIMPLATIASVLISFLTLSLQFPAALLGDRGLASDPSALDVTQYVRTAYATQAILVVVTLVAAIAVVGLLILFVSGRMSLMRRAVARSLVQDG